MNLQRVTLTGVDDYTYAEDLAQLSNIYPFVEWGFLISPTRTGYHPRYPSLAKMHELAQVPDTVHKAVHLCGGMARRAAHGIGYPIEAALDLVYGTKRVQVNLGSGVSLYADVLQRLKKKAEALRIQVILQTPNFAPLSAEAARGLWDITVESTGKPAVVLLHDASGGRGVDGKFERPLTHDYVGFAGGITPENVLQKLEQIEALGIDNPYWIDMETGVRTADDKFDITKAERVLSLVAPFVSRSENAAASNAAKGYRTA